MTGILQVKNGKYYIVLSYYENGKRQRRWFIIFTFLQKIRRNSLQIARRVI